MVRRDCPGFHFDGTPCSNVQGQHRLYRTTYKLSWEESEHRSPVPAHYRILQLLLIGPSSNCDIILVQMSSSSLAPIRNLLGPFFIVVVVSSICGAILNVVPQID